MTTHINSPKYFLFPFPAANMDRKETNSLCKFDIFFKKYVPHILEKIFFSLDYEAFKTCLKVNNTWKELLTSKSYQKKRKFVFHDELLKAEKKLWLSAKNGNIGEVQNLLHNTFMDVNCVNKFWLSTPLYESAHQGHKAVVKLLLDSGAEANKADKYGYTPLHKAACRGHKEVVELLLDRGADPSKVEEVFKETALHKAAYYGHKDVVQLLLVRGADPNEESQFGSTPIHLAQRGSNMDVVHMLNNAIKYPNM